MVVHLFIRKKKGNNMAKIYYENTYTDENGIEWLSINGDTDYPLNEQTKEEARKDYLNPESETQRQIDFMRVNGFYD